MRGEIAVVRHIDKGMLNWRDRNVPHQHLMEDTPVKALCAVVLVLSSLGAPAQALDASTAYCVDDFFGGIIEQSTIPAQIVATEPTIEKLGEAVDEAHGVTITGPKDAANVPVGAIQPSDETRTVEYATGKGNKLMVRRHTIEQNTIPAQIVATEPAIEKLGEPTPRWMASRLPGLKMQRMSRSGRFSPATKPGPWNTRPGKTTN